MYNLKVKTKGSYTTYLNNQFFKPIGKISSWTLINGGATAIHPIIFPSSQATIPYFQR